MVETQNTTMLNREIKYKTLTILFVYFYSTNKTKYLANTI